MEERVRNLLIVLSLSIFVTSASSFLQHPDREEPQCVWYGECGQGWNNGKLNCPANETTKHAPIMTDPEGLRIIKDYCPSLYNGDKTRTCCGLDQLKNLESSMALPQQLLAVCPACFYNFINQICQTTCSPYQGQFVWANTSAQKPLFYTDGIPAVTYIMTKEYATSLFDSCKVVEMPDIEDEKAMSILCGGSISGCTPFSFLQYLGKIGNGQAPFPVEYVFTDRPWTAPDGSVHQPLSVKNVMCNETVDTNSTVIGRDRCARKDCDANMPVPPAPRPTDITRKQYFDNLFGKGHYETVEIKISRKDSQKIVKHKGPPPSVDTVNFTSIYDQGFLHQVLELQNSIAKITGHVDSDDISLDDVCMKLTNQKECVIESILQYYQNNASKVDAIVYDQYHIFVMDDYLDHFSDCARQPSRMACMASFGAKVEPYVVLEGYKGNKDYPNATSFVITLVLRTDVKQSQRNAWRSAFVSFMNSYSNPNMTITYTPHPQETPVFYRVVPGRGYSISASEMPDNKGHTTGMHEQPIKHIDIESLDDDLLYASDDEIFDGKEEVDDGGHCIWYDQCGKGWNNGALNCAATNKTRTPPKLTDPDGLRILKKYCTELYQGDNDTYTCCSASQLHAIEGNLALPDQILSRCPSCYYNFLNQICQMTCSPKQSNFLIRNRDSKCPNGSASVGGLCGKGIASVTYIMTDKFAESLYTSCKDVQMPSANEKALSLFCGRPADQCNATIWLSYMGSTGNGRAPFPIYYNYTSQHYITPTNQSISPLNQTNVRCNETVSNTSAPCSCLDCASSCAAVPPPPARKKPFTILNVDGISFIMGCIFAGFVIFFGSYAICYNIILRDTLGMDSKSVNGDDSEEGCDFSARGSSRNLVGSKPISPADISGLEKMGAQVEHGLETGFRLWGRFCAKHPALILLISVIFFGAMAGGIAKYDVTTDPVKLWSSDNSTARTQKHYFDSHFNPFYRSEMMIISRPHNKQKVVHPNPPPSTGSVEFSSLFDKDFMHQVLDLQTKAENLVAQHDGKNVTLQDICYKPLSPDNNNCTIESVMQYWRNSKEELDKVIYDDYHIFDIADYMDHFLKCVQGPTSVSDNLKLEMSCLATYGGPAFPWVVLGGYDGVNYHNATAFVITFVVNNHLEESENGKAEAWEAEYIKFMKEYKNENMTISFSSERSIQDELNRESKSDIWTILVSYLIMFAYITIALGHFRGLETIFIDSKVTLGLSGVTIVLLSVAASVGFYSYCNVPMTLIIIEVVPFLVLAVGVDNIFILVQTYQRDERKPGETLEDQIGRILGKVGPSMLLTSFSESTAFFLGALTDMPAVREFALYAALAVFFDFLLQITCFISLMTMDARRQEANRLDILCCAKPHRDDKSLNAEKGEGFLYSLVNNYYSHALLAEWVRPIVIVVFVGWFMASIAFACHLELGLDQALSMPKDSFVLDYFNNISAYLSVGAPVYFVVPAGLNYTSKVGQNAVCGGKGCPQNSLVGQVFRASQIPNYTYIAQPASSWIDDYFDWLGSEGQPPCCRVYNGTTKFCPATVNDTRCVRCPFQPEIKGRPTPHDFMQYMPSFLIDNPGVMCSKGGHAAYGSAVNLINNGTSVGATYFMTYHTPLKTSADYINALKEARTLAASISKDMNITDKDQQVFPYSVFYVFYEQYLDIVKNTMMNIGICMGAIFVVTFVLLGFDFVTALVVFITILMIIVDIMGMMFLWDISLNALSLVNLVMAIGISVEFSSHIARAFAVSLEPDRVLRAKDALAHMGSSVLSGITLTKLGGIIILAFSKSQLFQVFYFRMYLGMVVFGATHGLMFLPVFLSYVGPSINKQKLYLHQQALKKNSADDMPKFRRHDHMSENGTDGITRHQEGATNLGYGDPPEYNNVNQSEKM